VRCYRRALANDDREGIALAKLAKLHASMGQRDEAAHFHRLNLQRLDDDHAEGSELVEALQFLAQYAKECGRLQEAEKYCTRLLDFGGPAKEAAKALLREIRTAAAGASPMDA
jgi:anaphase-promoting complex subunit 8